jgi:uncharacterized phage infection (PIP) family protein YhgE
VTKSKKVESRQKSKDSTRDVIKKMGSISDATKTLASEVKTMSKIFIENQKILISLKDMISTVNSSLDQIQKNSRQLNIIEEDTQRLFSGISQVKAHSNLIDKINSQINKLQDHVEKIRDKQESMPDTNKIMQSVADTMDSIRNNTKMIMHVSEKTEKIREDIMSNIKGEINEMTSKTNTLPILDEQIRNIGTEINSLIKKTDSLSTLGHDIRNINSEFTNFKESVLGKNKGLDE